MTEKQKPHAVAPGSTNITYLIDTADGGIEADVLADKVAKGLIYHLNNGEHLVSRMTEDEVSTIAEAVAQRTRSEEATDEGQPGESLMAAVGREFRYYAERYAEGAELRFDEYHAIPDGDQFDALRAYKLGAAQAHEAFAKTLGEVADIWEERA